eukprot:212949_1
MMMHNDLPSVQSVLAVFVQATVTVLMTAFGALPFLFVRKPSARASAVISAAAAGMMLGASTLLTVEGAHAGSAISVGACIVVGAVTVRVCSRSCGDEDDLASYLFGVKTTGPMLTIILSMAIHSFAEGISIGVALRNEKQRLGNVVLLSMALHNIPEGLVVSTLLVSRGASVSKAAFWSVIASIGQPLMAVPAFVCVSVFSGLLPFGMGFAAGAMAYVALWELLPDPKDVLGDFVTSLVVITGLAIVLSFGD